MGFGVLRYFLNALTLFLASAILTSGVQSQKEKALKFLTYFNEKYAILAFDEYEAMYRRATNITADNLKRQIIANNKKRVEEAKLIQAASEINISDSSVDVKRQFKMILKTMTSSNESVARRVSEILTEMENHFNTGRVKRDPKIIKRFADDVTNLTVDEHLRDIMATSSDTNELLYAWKAWRDAVGPKVRPLYEEYVKLNNIGARENGFADAGDYKRQQYEVTNLEEISKDLLQDLQPFYRELHAYVRFKLTKKYPEQIGKDGLIPAHLLGNMWAQYWVNIFGDLAPYPDEPTLDVTPKLKEKYTVLSMFEMAEDFFASIGWPRLPKKFWSHSLLKQPPDRQVECHASAWDFSIKDSGEEDVRVKMCTRKTQEDFIVIHHELGHIYYFLFYWDLPMKFRDGANPAFHEAVGDILALSVRTPNHLKAVGLLDDVSQTKEADMNFLLMTSLEYIAFLPYGYLMDKWMWDVYSGHIKPEEYNTKWWQYRRQYQGIKAPVKRSENDFDPGGKLHISADVPFIRYFLSCILQFTFHKQACSAAGHKGSLHQCSIYQSKEAGKGLREMLALGKSKPWPDILKQYTGNEHISTEPIKEYFSPLIDWLKNYRAEHGYEVGWYGDMVNSDVSNSGSKRLNGYFDYVYFTGLLILCIFVIY